jgi:hypothetical protein
MRIINTAGSTAQVRRPLPQRRFGVGLRRLGVPMFWEDADTPPKGNGADGGGDKPTPPPDNAPKYTETDLQAKLRGQGKELEKLRTELEGLRGVEAKRKEAEAKRKEEEAKKKGEFEQLYTTTKTEAETARAELEAERSKREGLEKLLAEEVDASLGAVKDEETRKRWKKLLKDKPVVEQRQLLSELVALTGGSITPPVGQPGQPGRPKPPTPEEIRKDPALRRQYAAAFLASKRAGS